MKGLAAFVTLYLVVLGPVTILYLRREFDRKGEAGRIGARVRTKVQTILGRWDIERTLRREAQDERFLSLEERYSKVDTKLESLMEEYLRELHKIDKRLQRIEDRLAHMEQNIGIARKAEDD